MTTSSHPESVGQRWGVFGGTFDPIHVGHLVAARCVQHALTLDRMLFVVANDPWQKRSRAVSAAAARLAMVRAVVDDIAGWEASDIEIRRGGPSYMADTLADLSAPGRALFLLMGADAVAGLPTWERADEVCARATIVAVAREGSDAVPGLPGACVERVEMPRLDVSSTQLRAWVAEGRPIDFLVPDAAIRVIRHERLYTPGDAPQA